MCVSRRAASINSLSELLYKTRRYANPIRPLDVILDVHHDKYAYQSLAVISCENRASHVFRIVEYMLGEISREKKCDKRIR